MLIRKTFRKLQTQHKLTKRMSKKIKTGGRTKKNSTSRRISFTPSQQALDIYQTWDKKAASLDQAILQFSALTD